MKNFYFLTLLALAVVFTLSGNTAFAQLDVKKLVDKTQVKTGEAINYTIQYRCVSITNPCQNAVVTDLLPAGLNNLNITTANGSGVYNESTGVATINLGDLAAGTSGDITISAIIGTSIQPNTVLKNKATITATGLTSVTSNEVSTTVVATPNMHSYKNLVGNTATVEQGKSSGYSYYFANNGNVALPNVCITDVLPNANKLVVTDIKTGVWNSAANGDQVRVDYQTNTNATWTGFSGSPFGVNVSSSVPVPALGAGQYVTAVRWCFVSDVPPGMAADGIQAPTINFRAAADAPISSTSNCLDITTSYAGFIPPRPCLAFGIIPPTSTAIPGINKYNISGFNAVPGQLVEFVLEIQNKSTAAQPMRNAVVYDLFPTSLEFVSWSIAAAYSGTPPSFTITPNFVTIFGVSHSLIKWQFSTDFAVGAATFITPRFRVKSAAFGPIENLAYVTADNVTDGICGYFGNAVADVHDLDGDNNRTEKFCQHSGSINVAAAALLTSQKLVKGQCDLVFNKYPDFGQTVPGGLADYRLRVRNDGNIPMKNVVIIDILPFVGDNGVLDPQTRLSQWRPNLAGPVTPPTGVTVYYSQQSNPCRPELGYNPAGCTVAGWSLTPPTDITKVQSLKFDFGTLLINPADSLILSWPMRAPVDSPTTDEIAWNSFGFIGTRTDNNVALLAAEPIKVGIKLKPQQPAIYGDYVWVDTNRNGIQDDGATGISGVRVNLYKDNGDGLANPNTDLFIGFTVTDAVGKYLFPSLLPGDYFAVFAPPAGYVVSPSLQGNDRALDSEGIITSVTRLDPLEDDRTWDLGIYESTVCNVRIANYTISPCVWNGSTSEVTVNVFVSWANAPSGENINVTLNGMTKTILAGSGATSPALVSFTMLANNTDYAINAAFAGTGSCSATQAIRMPLPCQPNICVLTIDAVNVGSCAAGKAPLDVVISWSGAPVSETILVTIGGSVIPINVAGGALSPYTLSTTVVANGSTNVPIMARFSSTTTCSASSSYTSPVCVVAPSFKLIKLVSTAKPQLGDVISYTIVLANTGPVAATSVVVSDTFSAGLSIVPGSVSASLGSFATAGNGGTWAIASLPVGTTATLIYSASVLVEGVLFNTATIPGDEAQVCISVPIKVCKGKAFSVEMDAPTGYSRYQWYRTAPGSLSSTIVYDGPTNSYTATLSGEYQLVVDGGGNGKCPTLSCCPVVIEETEVPSYSAIGQNPTCVGTTPQANGQIRLTGLGLDPTDYVYQVSPGNSFTTVGVVPASPVPVPTNGVLSTSLTQGTYTVRVWTLIDGQPACPRDVTVMLTADCVCPEEICVPVVIRKTKAVTR